ncbi:MAG TPA: efflux RND transporter periplasmic adaptor subunit [Candidatus Saccharicenans sp.]|nr:efflux RND transporter periplasmic adaptor subunit [Candidatus Saccharicenans sp.]HOM93518.1 efflux RND transporter periplasmic adaptor subunit [Candidatus Saccharicenans sp.]HPC87522.1 efflux RND transporter periplasmic adaptor subunit [Candidatus Saccharicenans sp.]HPP24443.1 efflux RND transporter periplasmic adaptor subunit [Candidatus Saccharicenans sp.]HRT25147.1 efflux RND transporter periplasmic adaptor subunit [Candidatus Saccharicenans sp.]
MDQRRKTLFTVTLVIIIIIILAAGGFWLSKRKSTGESPAAEKQSASPAAETQSIAPISVKVAVAEIKDLEKTIKSPGEVYTEKNVVLKAEVGGILKKLYVQEGKHVRQGELLAELDDTSYQLKLEEAEATRLKALSELLLDRLFQEPGLTTPKEQDNTDLKKAQEAYQKAEKAYRDGLISQAELERTRLDYELAQIGSGLKRDEIIASSKGLTQAEVNAKIARLELEKTKIMAPFSGIITGIKVAPGETIEAGRELFTLVDVSQLKITAKVLETEVSKVKVGREADIRFSAFPGRVFKGKVVAVSPVINKEDKTCSVFIGLENPAEEIKPGMHAEIEIVTEIFPRRLLVPQAAVLVRGGRPLVFVVENGLAKWRYIQTGQENEQLVEVLDGVKEGEPVIVEGHMTLAHDSAVRIVE